jgi:hypothetical protein
MDLNTCHFPSRYADYGWTEKGLKGFLTACARYLGKWHEKQEKCKKWQVGERVLIFSV